MADRRSDHELLEQAQSGDRRALDQLLTRLAPQVWTIARRIMGSDADAADASQEALITIARGIGNFDGRSALTTWSHRVATNACLDELRRRNRRATPTDVVDEPGSDPSTPQGRLIDRLEIDRAIAMLSPEFRAVIVLREVMGHDYETIASLLAVPIGTIRSRLARARLQLAAELSDFSPGQRNVSDGAIVEPVDHLHPERLRDV